MIRDFLLGVAYISKGWCAFYGDKRLWRFAIIPFFFMLSFYALAVWGFYSASCLATEKLTVAIERLPDWLSWMTTVLNGSLAILSFIFFIFFLSTTIGTLYEFFGGLFFDSLTEYYEKNHFGITPRPLTFYENLSYALTTLIWGIRVFFIFCFIFVFSLFFPVIGQIILVGVMGYCFGITYIICSAHNNFISLKKLKLICSQRPALIIGFGSIAYLLLSIPIAAIFLLPALILGGSELFNNELKKEIS